MSFINTMMTVIYCDHCRLPCALMSCPAPPVEGVVWDGITGCYPMDKGELVLIWPRLHQRLVSVLSQSVV